MESEQTTRGLEQTLGVVRRRAPWILACFVVFAGAAYGYSKHKTKKYTATAALSFSNSQLSEQIAGLSSVSSSASSVLGQQNSDLESVKVGEMAAKTALLLRHGLTEQDVSASLSIKGQGESSIVDVAATSTSPVLAAAIANTYTRQFVKEQQTANRQFFKSALALVNKQLKALSPAQRVGSDGLDLQDRAHTLVLLAELGYDNAQLAQEAAVPISPSSPKVSKDTILGGALGLLLGLGIAFLLERLDRRIRTPEELEAIYGLPLLGAVPKSSAPGGSTLRSTEAEAFGLIRAHLRFFNVDRDLRTLVIASPALGDGKSTIARRLAEAAASLGSRVLLLEVDLRRPTFAQQFGIQTGPGLAEVLIGAAGMSEAINSVALRASPGEGGGEHTLDVLPAGAVRPPNPGQLLESRAMGAVLEQAKSIYDLVVIDTPPLTAVSDAFPLLTKVDGVVIVGWVGRSRRDAAERLQHVLAGSGAPLLGVIANGSKAGGPTPYPGRGKAAPGVVSVNRAASEELASTTKS